MSLTCKFACDLLPSFDVSCRPQAELRRNWLRRGTERGAPDHRSAPLSATLAFAQRHALVEDRLDRVQQAPRVAEPGPPGGVCGRVDDAAGQNAPPLGLVGGVVRSAL